MQQIVPTIPDNAPFSPEQREWLNGMLAEVFAKAAVAAPAAAPVACLKIAVYFATQSGTAERLAKKVAKVLKASGHTANVLSLEKATPLMIAEQEMALFFASTYGDGEPPESARLFRDALLEDAAPALRSLRYAVFCLGDSNYEHFCRFGIELDERLKSLGAHRILPRVESDVDVDQPFASWMEELTPHLRESDNVLVMPAAKETEAAATGARTAAPTHTRENPFHAELRERRTLTAENSSKQTVHLSFALEESALHYEAGDACGVIAQNDPSLVAEILSLLPFSPDAELDISKRGRVSVADAITHHLQITRLTRKMAQVFAERAQCSKLTALLAPGQTNPLDEFLHGRGLIDLLLEYPGVLSSPEDLASVLPSLTPRLYSISSSPAAHGREVHCTVGVVRYRTHDRDRGGVASTMLADRLDVGARLPIYIQPNKKFRIPSDGTQPMVMIGPGTGIAPFRGFLHERRAVGHTGRNWLFFGERSATTDFLYRDELCAMQVDGHLTRFDTAFSRDQQQKIYVQDRMRESGAELWRWLEEGAQVYVCGDASRMAKDVDAALHDVIERNGAMDAEAAREYVSRLQEDHRYHRDVY